MTPDEFEAHLDADEFDLFLNKRQVTCQTCTFFKANPQIRVMFDKYAEAERIPLRAMIDFVAKKTGDMLNRESLRNHYYQQHHKRT